jgi:DNA primase
MDALRWRGAADLPEVDPAERVRAAEEDAAERAGAIEEASAIWEAARSAAGSPAETYARSRGITMPLPPSIRFAETYAWRDKETGEAGPDLPALIGAVTDGSDQVVAIQRVFLRDGGRAKARMKKPKLSLGRVKGGALKLDRHIAREVPDHGLRNPDSTYAEIIITEGPEDGLSIAQEMPDRRVWVALGTAFMPEIQFPPEVRSIVIAGQNDGPGRAAVAKAAEALVLRGYVVRTMFPDSAFKDWNDQLRGIRI